LLKIIPFIFFNMKILSILILGLCLVNIVTINKKNKMRSHSIFYFIYLKIFFKKLKKDQELVAVYDTSEAKGLETTCKPLIG